MGGVHQLLSNGYFVNQRISLYHLHVSLLPLAILQLRHLPHSQQQRNISVRACLQMVLSMTVFLVIRQYHVTIVISHEQKPANLILFLSRFHQMLALLVQVNIMHLILLVMLFLLTCVLIMLILKYFLILCFSTLLPQPVHQFMLGDSVLFLIIKILAIDGLESERIQHTIDITSYSIKIMQVMKIGNILKYQMK